MSRLPRLERICVITSMLKQISVWAFDTRSIQLNIHVYLALNLCVSSSGSDYLSLWQSRIHSIESLEIKRDKTSYRLEFERIQIYEGGICLYVTSMWLQVIRKNRGRLNLCVGSEWGWISWLHVCVCIQYSMSFFNVLLKLCCRLHNLDSEKY